MFGISIDAGGTFTDVVLIDGEQNISIAKVHTDRQHHEEGIMRCVQIFTQEHDIVWDNRR